MLIVALVELWTLYNYFRYIDFAEHLIKTVRQIASEHNGSQHCLANVCSVERSVFAHALVLIPVFVCCLHFCLLDLNWVFNTSSRDLGCSDCCYNINDAMGVCLVSSSYLKRKDQT